MTGETRERLIKEHDDLVRRYNETDDAELVGCPRCGATLPGFVRLMPREGLSNEELTLTPAMKSAILNRCETLLRAVRKARAKANEVDVEVAGNKIGKKLLDYVFQPLSA